MHEPHAPFESVPIPEEFSSYLQQPTNRSFYNEWGSGGTTRSGIREKVCVDDDYDEENEEVIQGEDKETTCKEN